MSLRAKFLSSSINVVVEVLSFVDRHFGNVVFPPDRVAPYQFNEELRARGDILRTYAFNGWFVLNHADVQTLLLDDRFSSNLSDNKFMVTLIRSLAGGGPIPTIDYPSMLLVDAPDHTRLRRLAAKSFTNRYVQSLRPTIEQLVDELLDKVSGDQIELIEDLAKPLPAIVIAEMLGVPVEERHLFEHWSEELLLTLEFGDHLKVKRGVKADIEMRQYLKDLVERKRNDRGQDLLSSFIEAEEDGDKLTAEEIYSMCVLLLTAGHETTTRLIGSCAYCLLQNADQLNAVREDTSLLSGAIEETLRYEPPVALVSRTAKESFEYKNQRFKKGQLVIFSITAANRDPQVFENPQKFEIARQGQKHVSFGHGIHLCLGMPLARVETEIALTRLFDRYPELSITSEPVWQDNPTFRGLETLQISTGG